MITRPVGHAERSGRRAGLRGSLPALVLLGGLAIVAIVVVRTPELTPSYVLRTTRADFGDYRVGNLVSGFFLAFDQEALDPFAEGRLRVLTVLLTIVYFASVTALGSILISGIRGSDRWPRPAAALAGFLPGYLMVLAPLQLLYAAVSVQTASWIALLGMPTITVALQRRTLARHAKRLVDDRALLGRWIAITCAVTVVVVLAMVHRLQAGRFFLTQDSIQWVLIGALEQLQGLSGSHLGQWGQQSDEWVFGAPLMFWSHSSRDLWFPVYAAQCLSLVSVLSLVFCVVHGLARRRKELAATVAVASVFGSTLAIYPWVYITIIGGDNPVLTTGQTGRHIGIVAPWVALLLVGCRRRSVIVAIGFATLGLGFTSIEVLPGVLVAVLVAIVWRARRGRWVPRLDRRGLRLGLHLAPVGALTIILYAFWSLHHHTTEPYSLWWLLVAGAVALIGAIALCAVTAAREPVPGLRSSLGWLVLWLGVAGTGLILANNMTRDLLDGWFRAQLGSILPGYDGRVLERPDLPSDVFAGVSLHLSKQSCDFWNYCHGFPNFLATFGPLFAIALATWVTFGPLTADAAVNARRIAWLLMVGAFAVGFVVVVFNGATGVLASLLLSRFLEAPYYGLLALAAMSFADARSRVTVAVGSGVLILWTVIPLVATHWPQQMVRNAGWFLERAGVL